MKPVVSIVSIRRMALRLGLALTVGIAFVPTAFTADRVVLAEDIAALG